MKAKRFMENAIHGFFLLMGLVTVGCVLMFSVSLVVSGIPAIREIGLVKFLFGPVWNSNAAEPQLGLLPFILTSIYGTAGAILLGAPVGEKIAVSGRIQSREYVKKISETESRTMIAYEVSICRLAAYENADAFDLDTEFDSNFIPSTALADSV